MGQIQEVKVIRTCDNCGKIAVIAQPVSREQLTAVAGWYVVVKEHVLGNDIAPLSKLACSAPCAHALIDTRAIDLPTDPGTEPLDLSKVN